METRYSLTNIRASLVFDEVCLSAAIWRGTAKVGRFEECTDTGKAIASFRSPQELAEFEAFIQRWWLEADYRSLCTPQVRALLTQDTGYAMPVAEKIRCWVKHLAGPVEQSSAWKWQTRAAKQVLRSF